MSTAKIGYCMDKMQKIISRQMGTGDKIMHFWWMTSIITVNGEETSWVGSWWPRREFVIDCQEENTLNFGHRHDGLLPDISCVPQLGTTFSVQLV